MALVPCPECRREVSDQAISCPHCGYPIQQRSNDSVDSSLDETLRHLLMNGNKIAAVKAYRDHHPTASLSMAKEYVDKLEATLPATLLPNGSAKSEGSCLLMLGLLLAGVVTTFALYPFR